MPDHKKIFHLTATPWAMLYAPILNLASVLRSEGFENTIVHPRGQVDAAKSVQESLSDDLFTEVIEPRGYVRMQRAFNSLYRIARVSDNARAAMNFVLESGVQTDGHFYIGYDSPGAVMAWAATRLNRKPYAIFSLEIEENPNVGFFEKVAWKNAKAIITFDRKRAEIVAAQYDVPLDKFLIIPNSSIGEPYASKSDFLRKRLSIPDRLSIVLMTGTLVDAHSVKDVIQSVKCLPSNCALVLHGWSLNAENKSLYDKVKTDRSGQIFLSTEVLPHAEKTKIFASADIGIVSFSSHSLNHKYAGASAGKLFDFCQAGVPVVASNLPGLRELVVDNQIGYVVDDFKNGFIGIQQMLEDHAEFRVRCHRFFAANEFGVKSREILRTLSLVNQN